MTDWPITIVRMGADVDSKGDPIEYDWWHEIPAEKVDALRSHGYEVVEVVPAEPEAKAQSPAPSGGTGERISVSVDDLRMALYMDPPYPKGSRSACPACGKPNGAHYCAPHHDAEHRLKMAVAEGSPVSPPSAGSGLEESVYREIAEAMLTEGIERWNADPLGDESAHEWLGLTWDQYRTLIEVVGPREAL